MRSISLFLLSFLLVIPMAVAQQEVNAFDAEGKRHGVWKKNFPGSRQLRYQGQFEHGKEVGTFKFYCEDCGDQPILVKEFEANSDKATLNYYTSNGRLESTGEMHGKEKTGTWTYFHKDGSTPMVVENYENDLLEGPKVTYYADGSVTEEVTYVNGKREGESRYYSPAGVEIKFFTYKNDMLNGPVKYYDAKGNLLINGNYKDDVKHGLWQYYEGGKLQKEERFPKPNRQD